MAYHLDKILADVEDPNLSVHPSLKDQLYSFLEVALSFADDDTKHLTFDELFEHRDLYYQQLTSLGYVYTDFRQPIFNVDGMPGLLEQLKIDLIYQYRKKADTEFSMFAIEEDELIPRLPLIEVHMMEQIYELAMRDLWAYLVDTPFESLLDVEDEALEGNHNLVITKYYKHSSEW